MKKIIFFVVSMFVIIGGIFAMNNRISGVWWLDDLKKMISFLDAKEISNDYMVAGYCIKINNDEKGGEIYFYNIKKRFKFELEKISKNKYRLLYKGKKRIIIMEEYEDPFKKKELIWHFEDSSPYPPAVGTLYSYDGVRFDGNIDSCLAEINKATEFDQAESEMEDPDDLRE